MCGHASSVCIRHEECFTCVCVCVCVCNCGCASSVRPASQYICVLACVRARNWVRVPKSGNVPSHEAGTYIQPFFLGR